MAQLDPNIILQAGNFKTPDYATTLAQVANLKASGQEAKLRDLQIAGVQRENDTRVRLADAFNPTTGEIDPVKASAAYAAGGDIEGSLKFKANQLAAVNADIDNKMKLHGYISQNLGAVRDQASLDAARAELGKIPATAQGAANLPQQYDEAGQAQIQALIQQGQTQGEQLQAAKFALEQKNADYAQLDAGSDAIQTAMDKSVTIPKYRMAIQQKADTARAEAEAKAPSEIAVAKAKEPTVAWDDPKLVEVNDGKGGTQQITAQQNKLTGQWATADEKRTPLDATNIRVLNQSQMPGGGRVAGQVGRITGAGELVSSALENMATLPATANFGVLQKASQPGTILGALSRVVTPEDAQMYQAVGVGMARGLAALEAEGLAPSGSFTAKMEGLDIKPGDTGLVASLKLAEMRQAAESSMRAIQKGPLLTKGQQEEVKGLMDRLKIAIPWTPSDVIKLKNSKNPVATMREMGIKSGLGGATAQAPATTSGRFKIEQVQ